MSSAADILREYLEGAFVRKDPGVLDAVIAVDAVDHAGIEGQPAGIDGFRLFVKTILDGFPDMDFTVEDCFGDGDRAAARFTSVATHTGELFGFPPTGKRITLTGMDIVRVADGKIVELWAQLDMFGVMQQLMAP